MTSRQADDLILTNIQREKIHKTIVMVLLEEFSDAEIDGLRMFEPQANLLADCILHQLEHPADHEKEGSDD